MKKSEKSEYTHVEFIEIYNFLSDKKYPERITDKGLKSNFRRALIACLENDSFEPFPKSVKRRRGRKVIRNIKLSVAGKT